MQQQLDRVETALNALVDSITSYSPHPTAAIALLAADNDLNASVSRLAQHQTNVQTLHSLRESTSSLDSRIRSAMSLLADTRNELLTATPLTIPDANSRSVGSSEILNYAQRIARFTLPPTHRPPMPPAIEPKVPDIKMEDQPTPASGADTLDASPPKADGKAIDTLTDEQKAWLDPDAAVGATPFMPWPSEDVIRSGALSRIQAALEKDQDPSGMDLTGGALMEAPQADFAHEEEPKIAQPLRNDDVPKRAERKRDNARQPVKAKAAEEQGFGSFDLYDPEEE